MFLCVHSQAASGDQFWDDQFGVPGADIGGIGAMLALNSDLFLTGGFSSIGGVDANRVARWDGTNWHALGNGIGGAVYSMIADQQYVYVGGSVYQAGSDSVNYIARWDGTNWSPVGSGVNDIVFALASDGHNLYAGGHFTMAGGLPASKVARWNGTNWSALGSGIIPVNEGGIQVGAVDSLTVHGNDLFVGGRFRNAGSVGATNIARWDGTNWHSLGNGLRFFSGPGAENGAVRVLRVHQDSLFAGGGFRLAGNTGATNIARWDGTNWFLVGGAPANVVQALVSNGADLYAGGSFVNIGGVNARVVGKWDGNTWSALGSGISGGAIGGGLACNGTELFVGGTFTTAGGKPANNIALWHIPHALEVKRQGQTATLSWLATGTNFVLEAKENVAGTNWTVASTNPAIVGDQCRVTNQIDSPTRFFRLRRK